jgi:hypothetical protein
MRLRHSVRKLDSNLRPVGGWIRRLFQPVRQTTRETPSARLGVTVLEDRVTPSNLPFQLPRPIAPQVFNVLARSSSGIVEPGFV